LCRYLKQAAPGQTGGAGDNARREACRLALAFAQRWNAWLEEAGAQAAAVRGWQAVVEVAFTRRWLQRRARVWVRVERCIHQ